MMLDASHIGSLIGGIGLFLLGMWLMTEGLRLAAGAALRQVLATSTQTRLRALFSGIALTAVVQSSAAVTVAAISFVNAGLLSLSQVLWVLFGSNVGTTMTGWLVAGLGLQIKIDVFALPMVGLGMLLRLTGGTTRRGHLGMALAGLGVLFLGIDTLRESFSGLATGMAFPAGEGWLGMLAHVLVGAALTMLMQSSSVATALTLTATQGGLLSLESAAAVIIGANIGTTGTAIIAALGATANARRAAAAHVLFNVMTGLVALLTLPWLLDLTKWLGGWVTDGAGAATVLALFHTVFNLLGVLLMWPLSNRLAKFLEQRFKTKEEDEALPRYLDAATATVPALGVQALSREVSRFGGMALQAAAQVAQPAASHAEALAGAARKLEALEDHIQGFVTRLSRAALTQDSAASLAGVLRRLGYYASVVEHLPTVAEAGPEIHAPTAVASPALTALMAEVAALRQSAGALLSELDLAAEPGTQPDGPLHKLQDMADRIAGWEQSYQACKAVVLQAGALGTVTPDTMDVLLRSNSAVRRCVQQAAKATSVAEAVRADQPAV